MLEATQQVSLLLLVVGCFASQEWTQPGADPQHTNYVSQAPPRSPSTEFTFDGLHPFGSGGVVGPDGDVFVGSEDMNLFKFSKPSSKLSHFFSDTPTMSKFSTGGEIQSSPSFSKDGKSLYVASRDGYLYALSPSDLSVQWKTMVGQGVQTSSPTVRPSDGLIFMGTVQGGIYSVNSTGSIQWFCNTADGIDGAPAIGADGSVYVPATDNNLYKFNSYGCQGGTAQTPIPCDYCTAWMYNLNGKTISATPVVGVGPAGDGSDDLIFLGGIYTPANANAAAVMGGMWAVMSQWGAQWHIPLAASVQFGAALYNPPPQTNTSSSSSSSSGRGAGLSAGSILAFSSSDGHIFAVNATTGAQLWNVSVGEAAAPQAPLVIAATTVIAATGNGNLLGFALFTGALAFNYSSDSQLALSAPAVAADGTIYVGSQFGSFFAVGATNWVAVRFVVAFALALAFFTLCCAAIYLNHYRKTGTHLDRATNAAYAADAAAAAAQYTAVREASVDQPLVTAETAQQQAAPKGE